MSKKLIAGVLGATAAFVGYSYAVGKFAQHQVIDRFAGLPGKVNESKNAKNTNNPKKSGPMNERGQWFDAQPLEEVSIVSDRGTKLCGYILASEKPSDVFVFCSHGYRSSGRGEYRCIAKYYHDKGYNVLMVDHQASGDSEGDYIGFGYFEYQDSLKWLGYLINRFGSDIQIILHGISMGSATVMMMSSDIRLPKNVCFTVADCGYTSAWDEFTYNLKGWHVPKFPLLYSADLINRIKVGYGFKDPDPIQRVKLARVPMLFIHGGKDGFVPTYMGKELYAACNAPYKKLVIVDNADHAESYAVDHELYEQSVNEFADKYIKLKEEKKPEKEAEKKPARKPAAKRAPRKKTTAQA